MSKCGAKSLPAPCPSGGLKSFGKLQKTTSMYGRPSPSGVSAASTSVGSDSTAAASMVGDENIVLDGIDSKGPSDYNIQKESRMQIFVKTLTGQSEGVPEQLMFSMSACVGGEPRQKNVVSLSLLSLSRCCLVVALPRVPSTVRYDEISVTHQLLFQ